MESKSVYQIQQSQQSLDKGFHSPYQQRFIAEYSNWKQTPYSSVEYQENRYHQNSGEGAYYKKQFMNKVNYIPTINQLRQQYEILKDVPINGRQRSDGQQYSLLSYSSSKQSLHDNSSMSQKQKYATNSHYIEKQQLELVISNSMKKIQSLLTKQLEYKRRIHQLEIDRDKYLKTKDHSGQLEELKRIMAQKQQQYEQKIESLQIEINELTRLVKQLRQKVYNLQKTIQILQKENMVFKIKVQELTQQLSLQRTKVSDLEMSYTKIKREYEILERNHRQQISQIMGQHKNQIPQENYEEVIGNLRRKLESSERSYTLLMESYQTLKQQNQQILERPKEVESNINQMMINMIYKLREDSEINRKSSFDMLKQTISAISVNKPEPPKPQPKNDENVKYLLNEISELRREIKKLRDQENKKPVDNRSSYHDYIFQINQLRQKLEASDKKNSALMLEVEALKNKYQQLKSQHEAVQMQCQVLKAELEKYKRDGLPLENLRKQFKAKQIYFEENLHNLKKQVDDAGFRANKIQREKDFQMTLMRNNYQSQINTLRTELDRNSKQRDSYRNQLDRMKAFYDAKLLQKNQLLEKTIREYSILIQQNENALNGFKNSNQKEIIELVKKLESMRNTNDEYMEALKRIAVLERELLDLKQSMPVIRRMNENVEHLWVIKETQYKNLNEIVRQINIWDTQRVVN